MNSEAPRSAPERGEQGEDARPPPTQLPARSPGTTLEKSRPAPAAEEKLGWGTQELRLGPGGAPGKASRGATRDGSEEGGSADARGAARDGGCQAEEEAARGTRAQAPLPRRASGPGRLPLYLASSPTTTLGSPSKHRGALRSPCEATRAPNPAHRAADGRRAPASGGPRLAGKAGVFKNGTERSVDRQKKYLQIILEM